MRVYSARLALFLVWAGVFVFYVVLFFLLQVLKRDQIEFEQTADSCWKVMYVLTPVLSAFGMYWFMPQAENAGQPAPQDDQVLDHARVIAMFTITGVVHFV